MVGQTGGALHTMAVLQAYQADLLKDLDQGEGLSPEAVSELNVATDLALHATQAGRPLNWPVHGCSGCDRETSLA